ncbi:MAG: hypothetical protein B6245_22455 [Desulfobacteraceae bacterium 4572_88]|nr:MAG: hypothetical protein B6245_22455 [Desulfobacteraceae bacterium 4572_88]
MNPSADILKKHFVRFERASLLFYAGRSSPLDYKEIGRRFLFPECSHLIKFGKRSVFLRVRDLSRQPFHPESPVTAPPFFLDIPELAAYNSEF